MDKLTSLNNAQIKKLPRAELLSLVEDIRSSYRPDSDSELGTAMRCTRSNSAPTDVQDVVSSPLQSDVQNVILRELRELSGKVDKVMGLQTEVNVLKTRNAELEAKVDTLQSTLERQQLFLEQLDAQSRIRNVIITGLDETIALDGAVTDQEKISAIFDKIGFEGNPVSQKIRLGKIAGRRPLLVQLHSADDRNKLLDKAKALKGKGIPFDKIFIKKDTHPAVRREWKRLFDAEKEEKSKAENVGHSVLVDKKRRVLLRDDQVIDTWKPSVF